MPINFSPKVGQILTCNYGNYLKDEKGDVVSTAVDAHIPPEMIKCRLVVVLNGPQKILLNLIMAFTLSYLRG